MTHRQLDTASFAREYFTGLEAVMDRIQPIIPALRNDRDATDKTGAACAGIAAAGSSRGRSAGWATSAGSPSATIG